MSKEDKQKQKELKDVIGIIEGLDLKIKQARLANNVLLDYFRGNSHHHISLLLKAISNLAYLNNR